jgi:Concanavalin A-like lectin/glucanases superfamily
VCFILLTLLGDELWERVNRSKVLFLSGLFVGFLVIISFSFFELFYTAGEIKKLIFQDREKAASAGDVPRVQAIKDFVRAHTAAHEKIIVFTDVQHQGLYFDGDKRRSAFNPGYTEMFLNSDYKRLENEVADSSFGIFIDPAICKYPSLSGAFDALAATYQYEADYSGGNPVVIIDVKVPNASYYVTKRKTKIPGEVYFQRPNQLIHRKYNDDRAGIRSRMADASGLVPLDTGLQFSVELLFNTAKQIYPVATLIGNISDNKGFAIKTGSASFGYYFVINNEGTHLALPGNQWVYSVMNVFRDHFEIYINGAMAGTFPLTRPVWPSPQKLFVGNMDMNYFVGAIAEIAINSNPLEKNEIEQTWKSMK